jgi:hypothetical protein
MSVSVLRSKYKKEEGVTSLASDTHHKGHALPHSHVTCFRFRAHITMRTIFNTTLNIISADVKKMSCFL